MMKTTARSLILLAAMVLLSLASIKIEGRGATADGDLKGQNKTGCVEVVEAKNGSAACPDTKSISLRLKANCEKPVDVRVCYKGKKGWLCRTFTDKKSSEEFTLSECDASGPYVIYKRDAGSDVAFPNPK